ncbi:unnamed protein product [Rhizophagus irregularis]|uniref:Uncharacterized protein n=1 Tax=Rhizophagus irregularis TaxID=588596 RepID=A0A2I1HLS7_9GLOM|nr:hypothetical protein RhiirA4_482875 [Rhizophagus irregularis]CAB4407911.1 unnamed protein product [Rhizophagus irregularis]
MKDKIMIAMNVKKIEMEHLDDNDKIGFGYIIMCNCNGQELNCKIFQENDLKKALLSEDSERKRLNYNYFMELRFMEDIMDNSDLNISWLKIAKNNEVKSSNIPIHSFEVDLISYTNFILRWNKKTISGN